MNKPSKLIIYNFSNESEHNQIHLLRFTYATTQQVSFRQALSADL